MKVTGIYCFSQKETLEAPALLNSPFVRGDMVIFSDEDGREKAGKLLYLERKPTDDSKILEAMSILRKMTARDIQVMEANLQRGDGVLEPARQLIESHNLDMQLFDAAYSFDGSRINFIFTADDRVDFRDLVKDLAKRFQKQIHLKQIGPRDKAKIVTGFGRCGRQLCCSSFLPKLESITMDMVRFQDLMSKGSSKLSGACGKLLCCLKYEVEEYKKLRKELPPIDSIIKTKDLEGKVIGFDILNQKVKIYSTDRNVCNVALSDITKIVAPVDRSRPKTPDAPPKDDLKDDKELTIKE